MTYAMDREIQLNEFLPRILPDGWTYIQAFGDGYTCRHRSGLRVIASGAEYEGREWLHVSLSREDRIPSYDDIKHAKETFIGNGRWAAQLFPPVDQHVNIHQFCLHLWCPATGALPWPNFGEGGSI